MKFFDITCVLRQIIMFPKKIKQYNKTVKGYKLNSFLGTPFLGFAQGPDGHDTAIIISSKSINSLSQMSLSDLREHLLQGKKL